MGGGNEEKPNFISFHFRGMGEKNGWDTLS
jgi:hypothetical protein